MEGRGFHLGPRSTGIFTYLIPCLISLPYLFKIILTPHFVEAKGISYFLGFDPFVNENSFLLRLYGI